MAQNKLQQATEDCLVEIELPADVLLASAVSPQRIVCLTASNMLLVVAMDRGQRKTKTRRSYEVLLYSKAAMTKQPAVILCSLLSKKQAHLQSFSTDITILMNESEFEEVRQPMTTAL